ncbi:Tyrosine-protein phosphatase non-receptor type 1 [Armadillidium vulgare]|nr:Tyrosine-protein phosphatase non-receptor type 1 [Armadillidium vulgare]
MSNSIQVGLNAIQEEFNKIEERNAWNEVYQKIRVEGSYDLSCSEALRASNKSLNRYKDVLPYDHSRVMLGECDTDYVNASLVEIKCHQYWPFGKKKGGHNINEYPSANLTVELVKDVPHSHYVYRVFKVSIFSWFSLRLTNTKTEESREILHFHYTTWSDFGVPQSPDAFFKFLSVVRASECLESNYGPAVIHCSAGIGRSGTFCLVDSILLMLERGLCSEKPGKILEVLLDMRRYRMGLIQTSEQLRFSYQAILYGAQKQNETNGLVCKIIFL